MDTESKTSSNNSILPLVYFILNIVVISNTDSEGFKLLDHHSYYNFILFHLVTSVILLVLSFLTCCGFLVGVGSSNSEHSGCCVRIIQGCWFVAFLGIMIGFYYFMGVIWHDDASHSILFYRDFWSEGIMDFNKKGCSGISKQWAYVMSDVLVRIYSTIILLMTIIVPPLMCCFGGMFLALDKEDKTPASHFSSAL